MKRRNSYNSTTNNFKQLFKKCPKYSMRKVMKPRGKTFRNDCFTHNLFKMTDNPY